jgi:peptidoglycan/LPS O-acetylase OafA/YrhL
MSMTKKIIWNSALIFLILSYGSYTGDGCHAFDDDICDYWKYVTFGKSISKWNSMYIGAIATILLVLTSQRLQAILSIRFFKFLGRISYTLYLVHELVIYWPQFVFIDRLVEKEILKYRLAVFLAFCIFSPVLIFVSWLLLILVDDPFKNCAYEIDILCRKKRPPFNHKADQSDE